MAFQKKLLIGMALIGLAASGSVFAASNAKNSANSSSTITSSTVPVNVNKADVASLESIKGLGATKAQAIIDYRTKNGNFKSVDDVENVPGIGPKLLEKIQSQLMV